MVKKITLTGTDNDGFRHRYSVKKNEEFKEAFLVFMAQLEFNPEEINKTFLTSGDDSESIELKIADFEDCVRHYQNRKFDVDVFFGKAKIIVVVRTKERFPMVKHLEKKAGWIKMTEIKKIRNENIKKRKAIPLQKTR